MLLDSTCLVGNFYLPSSAMSWLLVQLHTDFYTYDDNTTGLI